MAGKARFPGTAAAAVVAAALAGCSSARYVLIEPSGGTVAIFRNTPALREEALALARQKCPRGFDIVREEEVAVGTEVTTESSTRFDAGLDDVRTTERLDTRRRTEWRITFTCR